MGVLNPTNEEMQRALRLCWCRLRWGSACAESPCCAVLCYAMLCWGVLSMPRHAFCCPSTECCVCLWSGRGGVGRRVVLPTVSLGSICCCSGPCCAAPRTAAVYLVGLFGRFRVSMLLLHRRVVCSTNVCTGFKPEVLWLAGLNRAPLCTDLVSSLD